MFGMFRRRVSQLWPCTEGSLCSLNQPSFSPPKSSIVQFYRKADFGAVQGWKHWCFQTLCGALNASPSREPWNSIERITKSTSLPPSVSTQIMIKLPPQTWFFCWQKRDDVWIKTAILTQANRKDLIETRSNTILFSNFYVFLILQTSVHILAKARVEPTSSVKVFMRYLHDLSAVLQ